MIQTLSTFLISFFLPLLVLRPILQRGARKVAKNQPWETSGWRTHHHHYGVLLLSLGILVMIASNNSLPSLVPTGIGLGLVMDEFIASLFLTHKEPEGSRLYRRSLSWTIALFCTIALLLLLLGRLYT